MVVDKTVEHLLPDIDKEIGALKDTRYITLHTKHTSHTSHTRHYISATPPNMANMGNMG